MIGRMGTDAIMARLSDEHSYRPVIAGRDRPFTSSENIKAGPILASSSRPANSSLRINQTVLSVIFDKGPKAGTYRELYRPAQPLTCWKYG